MESSAHLSALEDLAASPPSSQLSTPLPWRFPLSETVLTGILGNILHKSYSFHYNVEGKKKHLLIFTQQKMCSLASSIT